MRAVSRDDLASFLAIARHRSFRRAADTLGCTPSALSHALRSLEERLELRLFNRTTRSVALTEAGAALFARLEPAYRDIDLALDDLNSFRGTPTGTLRINASRSPAEMVLVPYVTRFLAKHPRISVEISVTGTLVEIVSAQFDAGVRFGEMIAQDMIAIPIGPPIRTAIVASPDFFARYPRPVVPEDLMTLPCLRLRFDSGRYYGWEFERDGEERVVEVTGPLAINDQTLMLHAALAGTGIAYMFEDQVQACLADGRLVRVLEDWCPPYSGFHLYYPSRRQMPAPLRAFVDFIRQDG